MKKLTLLLFLWMLWFPLGAQKNIEALVLAHVNHLRDSLNLKRLKTDRTLLKAAEDHAYYMSTELKLSHFQETFSKETPSERVLFYGGNRTYTGENIASVPVIRTKQGLNDSLIARKLYHTWLESPPHYQNMIHPDYTLMALSYKMSDSSKVYSAQVFSSNEIRMPAYFKPNKFSWGVRPAEKTCKDAPVIYETMFFANSIEVDGNDIYFYFHDLDFFRNVISGDNDGLAIDVVVREQLPCYRENQFHVSQVYDGEMQQPIYKHDLFRNDVSGNPRKIRVKIGTVPPHIQNKQWDANVIIINNNKLCDYSVPADVPSDIFPLLKILPYYDDGDSGISAMPDPIVEIKGSIHVEVEYARSSAIFYAFDHDSFKQVLHWGPYIKNALVECYASVEGDIWYNYHLLKARKNDISQFLRDHAFSPSKVEYVLEENWPMMNEQIETHQLQNLKNKNEYQIKQYLDKNKSAFFDSLLFEQRKTHIYATVDTTITVKSYDDLKFAIDYSDSLTMDSLPWNQILKSNYIDLQHWPQPDLVDSLADRADLKTNLLAAASFNDSYYYLDSVTVETLLRNIDYDQPKQTFNYIHFLSQYWYTKYAHDYRTNGVAKTVSPNDLRLRLSKLDTAIIDPIDLLRLDVNLLLSGIHYHAAHNNWGPVDLYFEEIANLVQANAFTAQEAMELALFCNHFHKFKLAVKILHPFHEEKSLSENGYFVLAKTATLVKAKIDIEDYWTYMASAKKANHTRYCHWLDDAFQVQRDEYIKRDFCKSCP